MMNLFSTIAAALIGALIPICLSAWLAQCRPWRIWGKEGMLMLTAVLLSSWWKRCLYVVTMGLPLIPIILCNHFDVGKGNEFLVRLMSAIGAGGFIASVSIIERRKWLRRSF